MSWSNCAVSTLNWVRGHFDFHHIANPILLLLFSLSLKVVFCSPSSRTGCKSLWIDTQWCLDSGQHWGAVGISCQVQQCISLQSWSWRAVTSSPFFFQRLRKAQHTIDRVSEYLAKRLLSSSRFSEYHCFSMAIDCLLHVQLEQLPNA